MKRNSKNSLNPLAQAVNEIDEQELQFFLDCFQAHIDKNGAGIDALLSITLGPDMAKVYEYMLNELVFDVFSGNVFDYFNVTPLATTTAAPSAYQPISLPQVASAPWDEDTAPAPAQHTEWLPVRADGDERPPHASQTDAADVLHMMPVPPQLPLPALPPQLPLPALPPQFPLPALPTDTTLTLDVQPRVVVIDLEQALCESYPDIYLHGDFTLAGLHSVVRGPVDNPTPFADAYAAAAGIPDIFMNEVVCADVDGPWGQAPEVEISYYLMSCPCDALAL